MKAFILCIDWYGPHSRMSLHRAALGESEYAGLYLAFNRLDDVTDTESRIRYIGMSRSDLPWRVRWNHGALDRIEEPEMWGGLVTYHDAPGSASDGDSPRYGNTIDYAESVLIYLLQPNLNVAKRVPMPAEPAIIVNRWFNGEAPHGRQFAPDPVIPDYLEYDPKAGATLAWHGDEPRTEQLTVAQVESLGRIKL